jgi:Family of unknown function (DUF6152)
MLAQANRQEAGIGDGGGEMKANGFLVVLIIVALILVATPRLVAHHSFAASYDLTKPITVKGTITRVDWGNPHISFFIDVKDKAGTVTAWGVDAASPSALAGRGLDKTSLKVGSAISVEAFPARNGKPFAAASALTLPDGRRIFAGSDGAVSR